MDQSSQELIEDLKNTITALSDASLELERSDWEVIERGLTDLASAMDRRDITGMKVARMALQGFLPSIPTETGGARAIPVYKRKKKATIPAPTLVRDILNKTIPSLTAFSVTRSETSAQ
jgi:hypothetical protein